MKRRTLITYTRLSWQQHYLLLQALHALSYSALLLRLVPLERLARWLSLHSNETPLIANPADEELAAQIGWAISAVANRLPGTVKCLTRALAASLIGRASGLHTTLYLGVARAENGQLQAHAWARCGARVITGEAGRARFAVIACFSC